MSRLHLMPGAAVQDKNYPVTMGWGNLIFVADASPHQCGWTMFVPPDLRNIKELILRLVFQSSNPGPARLNITWFNFKDFGSMIQTGSTIVDVPCVGITYIDLDIATWLANAGTIFSIILNRDSSDPADLLPTGLSFLNGRTLEV